MAGRYDSKRQGAQQRSSNGLQASGEEGLDTKQQEEIANVVRMVLDFAPKLVTY